MTEASLSPKLALVVTPPQSLLMMYHLSSLGRNTAMSVCPSPS